MSYSTIYDLRTAHTITDGVQSQKVCDATILTARRLAADRGAGRQQPAPHGRSDRPRDRGGLCCSKATLPGRSLAHKTAHRRRGLPPHV